MAKSFTLYVLKAVISGRGDEVVNFAKTFLWRYRGLTMAAHGILVQMSESPRVSPATGP
jgi:hypothetical protein